MYKYQSSKQHRQAQIHILRVKVSSINEMLAHSNRYLRLALLPKHARHLVLSRSFNVQAHRLALSNDIRKICHAREGFLECAVLSANRGR